MGLVTAATDGWTDLRWLVLRRDGGCVARQVDKVGIEVATDECQNANGWPMLWDDVFQLELDHVKEQPNVGAVVKKRLAKGSTKAPDDEAHLVAICPWHHRGGKAGATWATSHRPALRKMLARLYPEVWGNAT